MTTSISIDVRIARPRRSRLPPVPFVGLTNSEAARLEHQSGDASIVLDIVCDQHAYLGVTVAERSERFEAERWSPAT